MNEYQTIVKNRKLSASQDYSLLRGEGINHIRKLASDIWTDYNTHDPGITILELLCYAITDLGYRTSFKVEDLLAYDPESSQPKEKLFYSAKEILPCNPTTINDFRKLLIDIDGIKNAWMLKGKQEVNFYADCEKDKLTYDKLNDKKVENRNVELNGLYDVLLEFDVFVKCDDPFIHKAKTEKLKGNILSVVFTMACEMDTSWIFQEIKIKEIVPINFKNDAAKKEAKWDNVKLKYKIGNKEISVDLGGVRIEYSEITDVNITSDEVALKNNLEEELSGTGKGYIIDTLKKRVLESLESYASGDLNDDTITFKAKTEDLKGSTLFVSFPMWYELDTAWLSKSNITEIVPINFSNNISEKEARWDNLKLKYKIGAQTKEVNIGVVRIDYSKIKDKSIIENSAGLKTKLEAELISVTKVSIIEVLRKKIKKTLEIVTEVRKTLHSHRNLCEDFVNITSVRTDDIIICADIETTPEAELESILAEIYFRVKQYLSPEINFYTLEELLKKRIPADEIFEGPVLKHGFIDNKELENSSLRKVIYVSDVISLIMDIKGVTAVKSLIVLNIDNMGDGDQKWKINVRENHKPRLNIDKSKIVFYKGILPFYADKPEALNMLLLLEASAEKSKLKFTVNDFEIPAGTYRETGDYYTVQHEFPLCYGIGKFGLSSTASQKRTAQAKQLKAYLLFYDQLLANYLSQLANVRELFSLNSSIRETYFANYLDNTEIAGIEELYRNKAQLKNSRLKSLTSDTLIETEEIFFDRRNRFLDHLMARFCEQFTDYVMLMYSVRGGKDENEIIKDKLALLNDYPAISRDRGKAFDYTDSTRLWNTDNVSGLEKRLARLLGVNDFRRRQLGIITPFAGKFQEPGDGADEFRIKVADNNGNELFRSNHKYKGDQAFFAAVVKLLKHARIEDDYEISSETVSGNQLVFNFVILDADGDELTVKSKNFQSLEQAESEIGKIVDFLKENINDEGFHLVEHILLRPKAKDDTLLTVCLKDDCGECSGSFDPYSFRITIIIPYWAHRFTDMNFRRFVENTIRLETPAHIYVKICWVDKEPLKKFEDAYLKWLKENSKEKPETTKLSPALNDLIEELEVLRTVYPDAHLFTCEESGSENAAILNQTKLGTINLE